MALFGRFHLVRVVLATVFLVLLYTIVTKFDAHNSLIRLPTSMLDAESLTIKELSKLSMANETCPVCFGRDACEELFEDMANGALKVSRTVITPKDLDQTVQAVYRKGRVRFWMRSQPSSPSLLKGFENYLCRKASKNKDANVKDCDVSVAAKSSPFLYSSNLEPDAIRGLYKAHLVSRRRIPITICPSYKLIQGLIQAFDDDGDQTLTAEEKGSLLTTLATNPEIAAYKLILNQKLQIPVLAYFGACGRLTFVQGPYQPLSDYIKEPLALRVNLGLQVLQMVDGFLHDDPGWLLFTKDLSYSNLVVTDSNQVLLKDLSHVMLLDKDTLEDEEMSAEAGGGAKNNNMECDAACFDRFYDRLVDTKTEKEADYRSECARTSYYAKHMFSLVCQLVLSDLDADVEHRRANPEAKSYPGLLHHPEEKVDGEEKPVFEDPGLIKSLLARCSSSPQIETRQEAALQLMEELMLDDLDDGGGDAQERDVGEEDLGPDDYVDAHNDPDQDKDEQVYKDVKHHYKEYADDDILET